MSNQNWEAADRRNRDQQNAQQAAAKRQQQAAAAERERQMRLHEAGIAPINAIIGEFIKAVRRAGSPDLLVKKEGRWGPVKARAFKGLRDGMWYAAKRGRGGTYVVRVQTGGDWSYERHTEGRQGHGPGGDISPNTDYLCGSVLERRQADTPENYAAFAQAIQEVLAQFLREHRIPLPRS